MGDRSPIHGHIVKSMKKAFASNTATKASKPSTWRSGKSRRLFSTAKDDLPIGFRML
jgi:hypothetical protein